MPSLLTVMRPVGALGDQDDATTVYDIYQADADSDLPVDDSRLSTGEFGGGLGAGDIAYVVFHARAKLAGSFSQTLLEMIWTSGSAAAAPLSPGLGGAFQDHVTGQIATAPGGDPWSWTALGALQGVGLHFMGSVPANQAATVTLAEVWVEVYGTPRAGSSFGLGAAAGGEAQAGPVGAGASVGGSGDVIAGTLQGGAGVKVAGEVEWGG